MNKKRITELEQLIIFHQNAYYNGEAQISDAEFDALWDELKQLNPQNAILLRVGKDSAASGVFEKAKHLMPMGSQEKAANPAEFETWALKQKTDEFIVEYKLDGASLELQYQNGIFTKALTRGDGETGDDITRNVLKMSGVVKKLLKNAPKKNTQGDLFESDTVLPLTGAVRGEVIMTHHIHHAFFSDKANCRNAANGLMKRKDGEGCEHLQVMCYDAFFEKDAPYTDELQKINWLKDVGFDTVPFTLCKTAQEITAYRAQIMEKRKNLDYDIDGLVIKTKKIDNEDAKRNRPEKQIAYKFSLEEAVTVLRNVIWSESGATYTPIGEFDAVELAGTTVKRASLNNPNTIETLGIQIGSTVIVTKRGEIIPKIEALVSNPPDGVPIQMPAMCSTCNTPLTNDGTRLFCANTKCSKRIHHRLEKWISVLDVRDFGVNLIKRLYESGRIRSIPDLYTLTATELAELDRMGEKSAAKVINSLQNRRTVPLAAFVAGFDIEGIGQTLVEKLVSYGFNSLEKLLAATQIDIANVYGFGDITAKTFIDGMAECAEQMRYLTQNGIITIPAIASNLPLAQKSFCFTGELLTIKRTEAEALVKNQGGTVKSSVTKEVSYLVTNDTTSGSSKNKKAAELGIPIINEEEFIKLLKSD